jgi:dTDP-4-dehydrorhamnose reductase
MRIGILGVNGQLGNALTKLSTFESIGLTRAELDLDETDSVAAKIAQLPLDVLINCAAYNFVDKAEDDVAAAWKTNYLGPRELARGCAESGKTLVHISSDYVFGLDKQRRTPYQETDVVGPLSVYAQSKLAGEYAVRANCGQHFVIRTCGLFGTARAGGKLNFIEMMLNRVKAGGPVKVVSDQYCCPTSTADLAQGVERLIATQAYGLFHIVNPPGGSWFDFAQLIFSAVGVSPEVIPVSSTEFKAKAQRPVYSVLDTSHYREVTGHTLPDLKAAVAAYFEQRS